MSIRKLSPELMERLVQARQRARSDPLYQKIQARNEQRRLERADDDDDEAPQKVRRLERRAVEFRSSAERGRFGKIGKFGGSVRGVAAALRAWRARRPGGRFGKIGKGIAARCRCPEPQRAAPKFGLRQAQRGSGYPWY